MTTLSHRIKAPLLIIEGTTVAGTRHISSIRELVASCKTGDQLVFKRDHNNIYDEWSVKVYDKNQIRIGYVSCDCNEFIARLLDGGRTVYGQFRKASQVENWTRIEMAVYLND